jgi:hypothetical protein
MKAQANKLNYICFWIIPKFIRSAPHLYTETRNKIIK